MDTQRRFNDGTTPIKHHTDFVSTLKQLSAKGKATLQNNKLCQKYISSTFSNGVEHLSCKKFFGEQHFIFYVLYNVFYRVLLVDTTNKGKSEKQRVKTKIFKHFFKRV